MHARSALVFFFVAVSAGSVGSAPPETASGAVWPEGFLESLEKHADPEMVLRVMGRARDGTPPPAAPDPRHARARAATRGGSTGRAGSTPTSRSRLSPACRRTGRPWPRALAARTSWSRHTWLLPSRLPGRGAS